MRQNAVVNLQLWSRDFTILGHLNLPSMERRGSRGTSCDHHRRRFVIHGFAMVATHLRRASPFLRVHNSWNPPHEPPTPHPPGSFKGLSRRLGGIFAFSVQFGCCFMRVISGSVLRSLLDIFRATAAQFSIISPLS